jgi:hypothetical protein
LSLSVSESTSNEASNTSNEVSNTSNEASNTSEAIADTVISEEPASVLRGGASKRSTSAMKFN